MAAPPAAAASGNDQVAREQMSALEESMNISLTSEGPQHDFKKGPQWMHESPYLPPDWETTSPVGTSSLKHIAMRVFLSDQSLLSPEHFATIPWHIARYIWESMHRCGKQTMWLWKMFAANYAVLRDYSRIYQLRVAVPAQPLTQYFDIMNSDKCHWGGVLTVCSHITDTQNLVALGNIKNLVALDIFKSQSRFCEEPHQPPRASEPAGTMEDSVVRSWMEMALSHGCFKHLRVLRIFYQNNITPNILWMLEKMPALELVVVSQCWNFTRKLTNVKYSMGEVPVQGWMARRIDYVRQEDSKDTRICIAGTLLDAYRMSIHEGANPLPRGENDSCRRPNPPTVATDLPLLEFQLPGTQYPPKPIAYATREQGHYTFVFHRSADPAMEKRPEGAQRRRVRKGLKRDLTEFLDDFLV